MAKKRPGWHVMVVEDDDDLRDELASVLRAEGYVVTEAVNGQDALDRLGRQDPPSLFLLDLNMPVMTGEELLEVLGSKPELCDTPVIILSAMHDRAASLEGAVAGLLKKPFMPTNLLQTVASLIGKPSYN
jgi:CheY-like chemotaxis protein